MAFLFFLPFSDKIEMLYLFTREIKLGKSLRL